MLIFLLLISLASVSSLWPHGNLRDWGSTTKLSSVCMNNEDYFSLKLIEHQLLQSEIQNETLSQAGYVADNLGLSPDCAECYNGVMTAGGNSCSETTISIQTPD